MDIAVETKEIMQAVGTDKKLFGKTILVAEDVDMNQQLIRHILESSGAQVVIVRNGAEALEQVKKQIFDCVLMDVQMPEMDGIQATVNIRNLDDPLISTIPIIAITANCQREDLLKYEEAGMDDYLAKPIVEAHLLDTILNNSGTPNMDNNTGSSFSENKLYDLTMIHSISGGDKAFIKKMVLLFIDTVPQNVQDLVDSTERKNWEQVSKMAHKLKSTIDSMGIRTIHDQIRAVEMNAKNQEHLELMPNMVRQIESVVSVCIQQLHREVN
ncbi:MAG TPA: response regulator [Puia sp.]|jgi:CheY-like chemotaxis protein/HPt (histidine-containing phosphotransfer) domain-containing protein|nr:response regulator [Puia sp.]